MARIETRLWQICLWMVLPRGEDYFWHSCKFIDFVIFLFFFIITASLYLAASEFLHPKLTSSVLLVQIVQLTDTAKRTMLNVKVKAVVCDDIAGVQNSWHVGCHPLLLLHVADWRQGTETAQCWDTSSHHHMLVEQFNNCKQQGSVHLAAQLDPKHQMSIKLSVWFLWGCWSDLYYTAKWTFYKDGYRITMFSFQVAESFSGLEPFAQAPIHVTQEEEKIVPLKKPPKWLRKPVGASFAVSSVCFRDNV